MIDLRSDTVTQPDDAMLRAMCAAPLGDDVFGDDPTVHRLEAKAAELLGKEAAIFVPSGTMGNAVAIGLSAGRGDEALVESQAHSFHFEVGGAAHLWGVQLRPVEGVRGVVPIETLAAAVRPQNVHLPRTRLVILEQTSNLSGGAVLPLEYLQAVGAFCRDRGLRFHLDGARIFNAAVAAGVDPALYAACADTVMFCVSKGLGAPAGSLLAGCGTDVEKARRYRKVLGGGLRQGGILAACGLHALEHNVARLAEDHARARLLAEAIRAAEVPGVEVDPPETNMVYLRSPASPPGWADPLVATLRSNGVLAVQILGAAVRFVFHKDISETAATEAREIVVRSLLSIA